MTRTFSCTYNGATNGNWRVILWNKSSNFAHLLINYVTRELGWWDYSFHGFGVTIADNTDTDITLECTGESWTVTVDSVEIGTFTAFDVDTYGFSRVGEGESGTMPLPNALYPSDSLYPSDTLYPSGDEFTYCNGTLTDIVVTDDGPQSSRIGVYTAGSTTIENSGDSDAGVTITITGPCNIPRVTNTTTGEYIKWNSNVTSGQTLVIDTNDATVYLNGASAIQYLDIGSTFWKLISGTNVVESTENGLATSASIEITWQDQYVGF